MNDSNEIRFAYDMVSKVFEPLKERIDNHATIIQRLTDKITEMNTNLASITSGVSEFSEHSEEFKTWKSRITLLITFGTIIMSVIGAMLVDFYFNIKQLNGSIEPLIKFLKDFKP